MDFKPEPLTKLVIAIFPIYGQVVRILTFSLIVTFYLTKTENKTQKSETQLSDYCFE